MHPKIKKFWQDAGYSISNEDQTITGVVTGYKLIDKQWSLSIIETIGFGNQHRFNGKWYSEEEMLKIINMKAFA